MNKRLITKCTLASLILCAPATAAQEQSTLMQTVMSAYNSSFAKGVLVVGTLGYIGWQWKKANQMQQEINSLRPLQQEVWLLKERAKSDATFCTAVEKIANENIKARNAHIAILQGELNHEKTQNTELLLDKSSLRNARDKWFKKATELEKELTLTNNTNTQLKEQIKNLKSEVTLWKNPLLPLSSSNIGEPRDTMAATPLGRPSVSPQKKTPTTAGLVKNPIEFFKKSPSEAAVQQYLGLNSTGSGS